MSRRKTIEEITEEFRNIHGNKYDYSLITKDLYVNSTTKLPIICHQKDENNEEHGIFYQDRTHHLRGHGCPKCAKNGIKYTNECFIKKVQNIHNDLLFDKCSYTNSHTKIIVGCKTHGYFTIMPYLLFQNHGCPNCAMEKRGFERRGTTTGFIKKAIEKHGDKYDYSKVEYIDVKTKVCIICPKHGEFWQRPGRHLNGDGCPICNESKLEREIRLNFKQLEQQKTFDWLRLKNSLYLDFYDNKNNIAIECQGEQHFIDKGNFGDYENIIVRDKIKYKLCEENGVKLIYYFPSDFLKHKNKFYDDKIVYHNIVDLKNDYFQNL